MGASNSSTRHSQKHSTRPSSRHSQYPAARAYYGTSKAGSVYSYTTLTHYPGHRPSRHQQANWSRKGSLASFSDMASVSGHRNRRLSTNSRTLLDKKCIFLGRYYARQFSQPVLQRLRFHVKQAKGTKTRVRLSTKGLTVGSKNNSLFKANKTPYEFFPLDDIHEVFVDNELRSLLIVIKGLADGHLELLTYKLTDELEARLYQQTFNEMVAMRNSFPSSGIHRTDGGEGTSATMARSGMHTSRSHGYHSYNTTPGTTKRAIGNKPAEGFVYRLKPDDGSGTPASRRHHKARHRSEGDALDEELRKQQEDREFLAAMRQRESTDINDNDEPDGPIRLIFSKEGIIETHGNASLVRNGELASNPDSDRGSDIAIKDNVNPVVVDSGLGTVRATVTDYRNTTTRTSTDHTDYGSHYGNGYVGGVRSTARSPTRNSEHITHQVVQDPSHTHRDFSRSYSPAPSHQSRTQSEGGWRMKMPWRRRSKSVESHGHNAQKWETSSLMVGGKKPMGKIYVPPNQGGPPDYIVMYPTLDKQMRARSTNRFEL